MINCSCRLILAVRPLFTRNVKLMVTVTKGEIHVEIMNYFYLPLGKDICTKSVKHVGWSCMESNNYEYIYILKNYKCDLL